MSAVVVLKSHMWNKSIEKFALKLYNETKKCDVDFVVLLHDESNDLFNQIKSTVIKNIVHKFDTNDIKSIYTTGFYNMWLSNHWVLMWFYRKFRTKYQYFWSVEYDVRICGDSSKLWTFDDQSDFLYTRGFYQKAENKYNSYYTGNMLCEDEKYGGFIQLARYSQRALNYLDLCYASGENGQDELITFSLIHRAKLTKSNSLLQSLIRGVWTWQDSYSNYNKKLYELAEWRNRHHPNVIHIYHPIK